MAASSTIRQKFYCQTAATPTAATVTIDGSQVYSGQIGTGQPLETVIPLIPDQDIDRNITTVPVTIAVTSGVLLVGYVTKEYLSGQTGWGVLDTDSRVNATILVNGVAPEWPATPVDPMPGGDSSNPDWFGWFFEVSAGETITFDLDNSI